MSDSKYQVKTKIFEQQQEFCKNDLVNNKILPFTNFLDKGYRVTIVAWREGKQKICQPVFARSDEKFTGEETLLSASVASDRSGNERGVGVSK